MSLMSSSSFRFLVTGLSLSAVSAAFAQNKPGEQIIELPKMVVTDSRELPKQELWHYATIPGFEILTNASDKETQRLIKDFQTFCFALDVVWPGLQQKAGLPVSLIICGKGGKFDSFVPGNKRGVDVAQVSLFLQDHENSAIILDFEAKTVNLASVAVAGAGGSTSDSATTEDPPRDRK